MHNNSSSNCILQVFFHFFSYFFFLLFFSSRLLKGDLRLFSLITSVLDLILIIAIEATRLKFANQFLTFYKFSRQPHQPPRYIHPAGRRPLSHWYCVLRRSPAPGSFFRVISARHPILKNCLLVLRCPSLDLDRVGMNH